MLVPKVIEARTYFMLLQIAGKQDLCHRDKIDAPNFADLIKLTKSQRDLIIYHHRKSAFGRLECEHKGLLIEHQDFLKILKRSRVEIALEKKQIDAISNLLKSINESGKPFTSINTYKSALVIESMVAVGSLVFGSYWGLGTIFFTSAAFTPIIFITMGVLSITAAIAAGLAAYQLIAKPQQSNFQKTLYHKELKQILLIRELNAKTESVEDSLKTLIKNYESKHKVVDEPQSLSSTDNVVDTLEKKVQLLKEKILGLTGRVQSPKVQDKLYYPVTKPSYLIKRVAVSLHGVFFQNSIWSPLLSGAVVAGGLFATYWGLSSLAVFGLPVMIAATPVLAAFMPVIAVAVSLAAGLLVAYKAQQTVTNNISFSLQVNSANDTNFYVKRDIERLDTLSAEISELVTVLETKATQPDLKGTYLNDIFSATNDIETASDAFYHKTAGILFTSL